MKRYVALVAGLAAVASLAGADRAQASGSVAMQRAQTASSAPELFATEIQDGPDWWQVTGVSANDTLNIRSGPGTSHGILACAPNGVMLRNLGCQGSGSSRWCQVETKDGGIRGWVSGRYLREASGMASSAPTTGGGGGGDYPELVVRSTGEIEVRWSSGCTMLYNGQGNRLRAGGSCSDPQRSRSDDAVARYRREQGGSTTGTGSGTGGKFRMSGTGNVTQGGPLIGTITSKNGRNYTLILNATTEGFTCTGSFDQAPGSGSMRTRINCTNGDSGSAILNGEMLTFSAGGKGGFVRF